MWACMQDFVSVAEALLDLGANLTLVDSVMHGATMYILMYMHEIHVICQALIGLDL